MHEWSLYVFTLALQTAIGGLFVLTGYNYFLKKEEADLLAVNKKLLIIFSALSVIGLIASFTHLGTPTNALNAISNLGGSWMSREILLTSGFIGLVVLLTMLVIVKKQVFMPINILAVVVGLADIFAMAKIYHVSIFPEWSTVATIGSFYGTALVLGGILTVVVFTNGLKDAKRAEKVLMPTLVFIVAGIVVQFVFMVAFGQGALNMGTLALVKWVLMGVSLLAISVYGIKKSNTMVYGAFVALIVAELVSRYAFYMVAG